MPPMVREEDGVVDTVPPMVYAGGSVADTGDTVLSDAGNVAKNNRTETHKRGQPPKKVANTGATVGNIGDTASDASNVAKEDQRKPQPRKRGRPPKKARATVADTGDAVSSSDAISLVKEEPQPHKHGKLPPKVPRTGDAGGTVENTGDVVAEPHKHGKPPKEVLHTQGVVADTGDATLDAVPSLEDASDVAKEIKTEPHKVTHTEGTIKDTEDATGDAVPSLEDASDVAKEGKTKPHKRGRPTKKVTHTQGMMKSSEDAVADADNVAKESKTEPYKVTRTEGTMKDTEDAVAKKSKTEPHKRGKAPKEVLHTGGIVADPEDATGNAIPSLEDASDVAKESKTEPRKRGRPTKKVTHTQGMMKSSEDADNVAKESKTEPYKVTRTEGTMKDTEDAVAKKSKTEPHKHGKAPKEVLHTGGIVADPEDATGNAIPSLEDASDVAKESKTEPRKRGRPTKKVTRTQGMMKSSEDADNVAKESKTEPYKVTRTEGTMKDTEDAVAKKSKTEPHKHGKAPKEVLHTGGIVADPEDATGNAIPSLEDAGKAPQKVLHTGGTVADSEDATGNAITSLEDAGNVAKESKTEPRKRGRPTKKAHTEGTMKGTENAVANADNVAKESKTEPHKRGKPPKEVTHTRGIVADTGDAIADTNNVAEPHEHGRPAKKVTHTGGTVADTGDTASSFTAPSCVGKEDGTESHKHWKPPNKVEAPKHVISSTVPEMMENWAVDAAFLVKIPNTVIHKNVLVTLGHESMNSEEMNTGIRASIKGENPVQESSLKSNVPKISQNTPKEKQESTVEVTPKKKRGRPPKKKRGKPLAEASIPKTAPIQVGGPMINPLNSPKRKRGRSPADICIPESARIEMDEAIIDPPKRKRGRPHRDTNVSPISQKLPATSRTNEANIPDSATDILGASGTGIVDMDSGGDGNRSENIVPADSGGGVMVDTTTVSPKKRSEEESEKDLLANNVMSPQRKRTLKKTKDVHSYGGILRSRTDKDTDSDEAEPSLPKKAKLSPLVPEISGDTSKPQGEVVSHRTHDQGTVEKPAKAAPSLIAPVKRGRGRPRKIPIATSAAASNTVSGTTVSAPRNSGPEIPMQDSDTTPGQPLPSFSPSHRKKQKSLESVLSRLGSKLSKNKVNSKDSSPKDTDSTEGERDSTGWKEGDDQQVKGASLDSKARDSQGHGSKSAVDNTNRVTGSDVGWKREKKLGLTRKRKTLVGKHAREKSDAFKLSIVEEVSACHACHYNGCEYHEVCVCVCSKTYL